MKNRRIQLALTGGVALYGLRWSVAALRTHFQVKPQAEAGDPAAKASVVQRPEASLLGIPNASYGVAYYAGLLALVLVRRLDTAPWRTFARAATLAALLRTLTLLAALLRSRTWCPVCMRAHVVNATLALLILPSWARR